MGNEIVGKGKLRSAMSVVITGLDILACVAVTALVFSLGKIVGDDGMPIFPLFYRVGAFLGLLFFLGLRVGEVRDWWFLKQLEERERGMDAEIKEFEELERLRSKQVRGPVARK